MRTVDPMPGEHDPTRDDEFIAAARAHLALAYQQLQAADARDEALASYVTGRRMLGIPLTSKLVEVERVWRLGALLLARRSGALYATGSVTRAVPPGHQQHQSLSAEERKGLRAAAVRAGFASGDSVNFDAAPISFDSDELRSGDGPLTLTADGVQVRWSAASTALLPFSNYLDERVDLLMHPPLGA